MTGGEPDTDSFLQDLVQLMDEKGLTELELEIPDFAVRLTRDRAPAAPPLAGVPSSPSADPAQLTLAPAPVTAEVEVKAPLLGTVHFVPGNGIGPGVTVREGQVLLTIEAMKVPHEVTAPAGGRVLEIAVREGDAVEYGQLLVVLTLAGDAG